MVQLINLGNLSSLNGKQVLTGSNSGLDTTALINELVTAKSQPATNLQTKITTNTSKIAAFSQFQTLLSNLQTSLNSLRNPPGTDASSNVFSARTPYVTMSDGSTSSNYIGVTTANGAPIGTYTLAVNNLATSETMQSIDFSSASGSAVDASGSGNSSEFSAGTFQINGASVTLAQGESLTNVAAAINSVSSQSNVSASITELSSNSYQLVLNGTETGAANAITISDPYSVIPPANNGVNFLTVTQQAQDASMQYNGETITRPTNTISDLLSGVTFTLYQPTPVNNSTNPPTPVTASLSIDKDDSTIANAIGTFADDYNAIRTFEADQNATDPTTGAFLSSALLAEDPTLSTIVDQLSSAVGNQTSDSIPSTDGGTTVTDPTRIGDLGISLTTEAAVTATTNADGTTTPATPEVDNLLAVDTTTLGSMLDSNFNAVQNIFQFNFTSSSADLTDFSRDNTVMNTNLTISRSTLGGGPIGPHGGITGVSYQYFITAIDGAPLNDEIPLDAATGSNGNITLSYNGGEDPDGDTPQLDGLSFNYVDDGTSSMNEPITISSKDISLAVDPSQPTGSQAQVTSILGHELVDPLSLNYSSSGGSALIQGATGSPFAGLQMLYTGTGAENINVSYSQGLADSVYNDLNGIINGVPDATTGLDSTGLIANATTNLTNTDTQLQTQITQIDNQVADYREQLTTQYANLESAIGSANSLLQLLSAQSNAELEETSGS